MGNCCSSSEACCSSPNNEANNMRTVTIDFLYLDLTQCDWCQGTEQNLDNAISKLSAVLETTGVYSKVNKTHITSEEQAQKLNFITSPTIRVNGKDIQFDFKESLCSSCQDLCGDEVNCRVWLYQGREYTAPPEGMIIDAILRELYGRISSSDCSCNQPPSNVPENLKKFFHGVKKQK